MVGRGRWLAAGGLLIVAGGWTAASTWRHWATCRPDLLVTACVTLQEETLGLPLWGDTGHRDALGTALAAVSATVLAGAWLLVSSWARSSAARTLMAAVVGLQPVVGAAMVTLELVRPGPSWAEAFGWLTWPAEILVVPLLLGAGWMLDESPARTFRLLLLGWAVTSFGPLHHFVDYALTSVIFGSTGIPPAGMGYVTAATQVALGLGVGVVTLVLRRGPEPEEGDEWFGQDGFTLAA